MRWGFDGIYSIGVLTLDRLVTLLPGQLGFGSSKAGVMSISVSVCSIGGGKNAQFTGCLDAGKLDGVIHINL